MDLIGMLNTFIDRQVFELAFFMIGLGFVLSKWARIDKKKIPWLFLIILIPTSTIYSIELNSTMPLFINIVDGVCNAFMSCFIAMGIYDIGKPIGKALLKRFAKANEVPIEEVELLKEPDPVPQPPQPIICACCGQEIKGENHEN